MVTINTAHHLTTSFLFIILDASLFLLELLFFYYIYKFRFYTFSKRKFLNSVNEDNLLSVRLSVRPSEKG